VIKRKLAFFADLWGNLIELAEVLASATAGSPYPSPGSFLRGTAALLLAAGPVPSRSRQPTPSDLGGTATFAPSSTMSGGGTIRKLGARPLYA
jgi:hypothetical protein